MNGLTRGKYRVSIAKLIDFAYMRMMKVPNSFAPLKRLRVFREVIGYTLVGVLPILNELC